METTVTVEYVESENAWRETTTCTFGGKTKHIYEWFESDPRITNPQKYANT